MARLLLWAAAFAATAPGASAALRRAHGAQQLAAKTRDPRDEEPFCVFWGPNGSSPVQVFVGSDNSRSLFFGTDDMGTQTSVKCEGNAPQGCDATTRDGPLSNCTQGCEYLKCDCKRDSSTLDFSYMKKMMEEVMPVCERPSTPFDNSGGFKMLLIGLGGGALPGYTLAHCPQGAKVESVEYDSRVVSAATGFFGLDLNSNNQVETNDGGKAVQERVDNGQLYDVVLVDAFLTGGVVPPTCEGPLFVSGLKKILKPGGKAIQQVWANQFEEMKKSYRSVFGEDHVRDVGLELNFNHLVIAEQPSA